MQPIREQVPYTPALVVDLPTVHRNVSRLVSYANAHKLNVRPHTKTHKSAEVARIQLAAGARGLTVAKVGEAEVMREASDDLLIAYPLVDNARISRACELAATCTLRVAIDSSHAAAALSSHASAKGVTIGILVDLDVGFHRTGLQSPEATLQLAQQVDRLPGLRLDGLFTYPGHLFMSANNQQGHLDRIDQLMIEARELWKQSGLAMPIVSGGSTPTSYQSHRLTSLTEIRPGTNVYHDMNCVLGGYCTLEDVAAKIICTVVSNAVPGFVVIDAGTKTLTSDRNAAQPDSGSGYLVEHPEARIVRCTEEHGVVDVSRCDRPPQVGERVTVIPNHICPCVNLQDAMFLREEDRTLRKAMIGGRGKVF